MTKTEEKLKRLNVPVYFAKPEGWREIKGATTAPVGYVWINNGKSLFSKDYQHGLLKAQV